MANIIGPFEQFSARVADYLIARWWIMTEREVELSEVRETTYKLYQEVKDDIRRARNALDSARNYLRS